MKKAVTLFLTAVLAAGLLFGCASGSAGSAPQSFKSVSYNASADTAMEVTAAGESMVEGETDASDTLPENRKWVITLDISAETEDLDEALDGVMEKVSALSGYVENQNLYNGSAYAQSRYRSASLTLRIPADRESEFTRGLTDITNVVSSSRTAEDITLQYVDTETRVAALETERDRLLELMEQAETMADLLEIEGRLTDVRYELESYASRLRQYDNQVDYATVYLDIQEVQEYTPVQELTFWQKITTGFAGSLKGLWKGIVAIVSWVIINLPYIVVVGALCAGCGILLSRKLKKRKQKKADKPEKSSDT